MSGETWALTQCQFLKGKDEAKNGEKVDKRNKDLKTPNGLEMGISAYDYYIKICIFWTFSKPFHIISFYLI